MTIPLSAPDITEHEIEAVASVLRTPRLSLGSRLVEFEQAVASRVGAAHAIAVSSGTAGLHVCLRACGIGPGDKVITSSFGFAASVHALLYERAVPVFVDVDPESLNIDPDRVEAAVTPRTRGILAVHIFGRPCAMPSLLSIARRHGLRVIEDACEALGAEVGGRSAGTLGACGVFAFYPNKQITTGEGGVVVTDDEALARMCRSLRNHGRDDDGDPVRLGFNYRLSEPSCALGAVQMRRLDAILARREAAARAYHRRLAGHPGLVLPSIDPTDARTSWFVYVVRLASHFTAEDRDRIRNEMARRGIETGRYFPPLHLLPHIREVSGHEPGDFPVTEAAAARTLALPFFSGIREAEIDEVCGTLLELLECRADA